jgi:hypothetical protein
LSTVDQHRCQGQTLDGDRCSRGATVEGHCRTHADDAALLGPDARGRVAAAAASGSSRRVLAALRDVLSEGIDLGPAPRELAALTARLLDVLGELDEEPVDVDDTPLGELQRRRAARRRDREAL